MRRTQTVIKKIIDCIPPFDFALSARILADGDPQIAKYDGNAYRQVLRIGDRLLLATVTSAGSVDSPQLRVEFASDGSVTDYDLATALETIGAVFNAHLDINHFYEAIRNDSTMAELSGKLRGLKNPLTPTVFQALFDSIVEQQISLNVAHVLQRRVIKTFGDALVIDGETYYAFPTPERLALASADSLRACGLSRGKAQYITGIAVGIVAHTVDLERLRQWSDTQAILDSLRSLRGVGVWTAELTAIRALNRFDVIPADDLGLRRWIAHYYCNDKAITSTQARGIAARWGKWKGLAGYYLVVAGILDIRTKAQNVA